MASKKNNRTSKTDHVLSLLSGGGREETHTSPAPQGEEGNAAPAQEVVQQAPQQAAQPSQQAAQPSQQAAEGQEPAKSELTTETPAQPKKKASRTRKKSAQTEQTTPQEETIIAPPPARREGERLTAPILQVARTNNEALSETIRDALSQALEEELTNPEPELEPELEPQPEEILNPFPGEESKPEPEPAPKLEPPKSAAAASGGKMSQEEIEQMLRNMAAPQPEPEPAPQLEPPKPAAGASGGKMSQEEIEQMLKNMAAPQPEPEPVPQPEPKPAPAPASKSKPEPVEMEVPFAPRQTRLPDGSVCMNVMEILVDERLERYVKMFGLCDCPRCLADARALALTKLPSKYVVMADTAATPMLSLYRAKFESQVIAQVIQACKTVMESPRHTLS